MKLLITLALLLLVNPAFSREVKFAKKVNVERLQTDLVAAGFAVKFITVSGDNDGTLYLADSEAKNPQTIINAHVYVDPAIKFEANRVRMVVLAKKWMRGLITDTEKDELIRRFIISSILIEELE